MIILIFIILFCSNLFASTYTVIVPELSQEQKDWNSIVELSTDTVTALRLAKQDEKFDYLKDKINKRQAIAEITNENEARRKRLNRGYAGHIYLCYIENRIKQIEKQDEAIQIEEPGGFALIGFTGIIALIMGFILGIVKLLKRKKK